MKGLIQRVSNAQVDINQQTVGAIDTGLLLLLGVEKDDDEAKADKLLHKVLNYRVFPDEQGRMNLSLIEANGALLIVSQFTLVAETVKGMRPGFSKGAPPDKGSKLYNYFLARAREKKLIVESGQFGANMRVSLTNDGPVTFWLES